LIVFVFILVTVGLNPVISSSNTIIKYQIETLVSPLENDWWEMFHHDALHKGFSSSTAPDNNQVLWSYQTNDLITSSPVVSHGRVYIGSWDHNLYCLDMDYGNQLWNYSTGGMITATPALENNRVYVGSQDTYLYCLNAVNGDLIWSYKTDYMVESSPTIKDDKVYFGSNDGYLYCLFSDDGDLVWKFSTQNAIWSSPVVTDDYVYFGDLNGIFYCLDINNGELVWSYTTSSGIWSSPAYDNGKVYLGGNDYKVYCLNADNGDLIWNYTTFGEVHSSPAIAYNNIYIGTSDGLLLCLNKETGAFVWNYTVNNDVWSQPSIAEGKVYFGNNPCCGNLGHMYCLNAYNGNLIWDYNFQNMFGMKSSPAITAGKVFVGAGDGKIVTFGEIQYIADANGPYYGGIDSAISFTGSVYGGEPGFSWFWEFGDGATSSEQNPIHIYEEIGQYSVSLTVTDSNDNVAIDETQAFIQMSNHAPSAPEINGSNKGKNGVSYPYTFVSTDPDSDDVYYLIIWRNGCGFPPELYGPYPSGEKVTINHLYEKKGTYTISAQAIDVHDAESDVATFEVTMPRARYSNIINHFLERFSYAMPILRYILGRSI
jgi:outer membrane protein assembly factor BamB